MVDQKYWRMCVPEYDSDYDCTFINGSLYHPYGIPGVACGTCGHTWGGTRLLPIDCPPNLRAVGELTDAWPISAEHNRQLCARVQAAVIARGIRCPRLLAGDSFLPSVLEVPSLPTADFLWSSLSSLVISERMRPCFENLPSDVAAVVPIQLQKFGSAPPTLPAPIPESGEPEDLVTESNLRASECPRYFEVIVSAESGLPHGARRLPPCPACERAELDGTRELRVYDDIAPGQPLFILASTLWVILTDSFKRDVERLLPTNVKFAAIG